MYGAESSRANHFVDFVATHNASAAATPALHVPATASLPPATLGRGVAPSSFISIAVVALPSELLNARCHARELLGRERCKHPGEDHVRPERPLIVANIDKGGEELRWEEALERRPVAARPKDEA